MSDCSICYDAVIEFPAPEATGSYRSSCGHLFHPKCIATWHLRQEESTCPMCRKVATEMEDCAYQEENEHAEEEDEWQPEALPPPPLEIADDAQRKREIVAQLSSLAAELALLMGAPLPVAEPLEDGEDDLARLSRIEIVEAEEEAVHVPGPFDFVADLPTSPRFTLSREDIQRLLLRNGSNATMEEFFNEEDGEEQTLVVTMTLESLNARFLSLGAAPVTFMEATVAVATLTPETETPFVEVKAGGPWPMLKMGWPVLNPEDDEPELLV